MTANGLGNVDENNAHAGSADGAGGGGVADRVLRECSASGNRVSNSGAMAGGVTPIPSSIVRAACAVQASVAAIAKTQFNKHGQYKFASTDDIYAAITRKLGEVGLMVYPLELAPVQREQSKVDVFDRDGNKTGEKTVSLLHFHFGYVLATETDTWFDPRSSRSITVLHTGPQTYNAAESFCQKAYLRAWLKLPTGDMDLDSMPQADNEDDQVAANAVGPRAKRKSSAEGKRDGSVAEFNKLVQAIATASNRDDLQAIYMDCADTNGPWAGMPSKWAGLLQDDYDAKMEGFAALTAAE